MTCTDDRRGRKVRAKGRNGIDAVSVSGVELTLTFFGTAPEGLRADNFRIDGGRRITGIEVVSVLAGGEADPDLEGSVRLIVDRPGDLSTYRLTVLGVDEFDPRFRSTDFRFVTGCDDLDCSPVCDCPPIDYPPVEIDYLAKDYASFRALLLERLSVTMPQWSERHVPDIGITLVELLAYEGDRLSYLQDAVATEAYLNTARLRTSVRRHARLVDYRMHDGCAARAWVQLEVSGDVTLDATTMRFVGATEAFEPLGCRDIRLWRSHNAIAIWTWGDHDCCLPIGTTSTVLVDDDENPLHLEPGDVVIFEETVGARTGAAADRDAEHRQAVRLTEIRHTSDSLYEQPLLEVHWDRADALRFPLCINTRGGPECTDLDVGVVRGNIVLVEHGETCDDESLDVPFTDPPEPGCPDVDCSECAEAATGSGTAHYPPLPRRFRPKIMRAPITHSTPFSPARPATEAATRWLRGVPTQARNRLMAIQAAGQPLSEGDTAYLRTLFGEATLVEVGLGRHPDPALTELLARFGEFLATKLTRLDHLVAATAGGRPLSAERDGWELAQSWGITALDPLEPRFLGPAVDATRTDPRAALPDLVVVDRDGDPWTPRTDLLDSGPDDRHFVAESDDSGHLHLRFGDGRNGAAFGLPAPGDAAVTVARYRVGNGAQGNVGAEAIDRVVLDGIDGAGITKVRNPLPACGGVDPETVAATRARAPHEAGKRRLRAVTAADYAELAARTTGVQRAAAELVWTGSWYEAQVAVDAIEGAVAPDWLLDEVRGAMHGYRRIGHDLSVGQADLVPLHVALCVQVKPGYVSGIVRACVLATLGTGRGGFFAADRLTFGTPIRVSALVAAAASVPGVLSVDVTALDRLFGPPTDALTTGVLELGAHEIAQLDNDPSRPENGRLQLKLAGGR